MYKLGKCSMHCKHPIENPNVTVINIFFIFIAYHFTDFFILLNSLKYNRFTVFHYDVHYIRVIGETFFFIRGAGMSSLAQSMWCSALSE
jgi:hypothetical protein